MQLQQLVDELDHQSIKAIFDILLAACDGTWLITEHQQQDI